MKNVSKKVALQIANDVHTGVDMQITDGETDIDFAYTCSRDNIACTYIAAGYNPEDVWSALPSAPGSK